MARLAALERHAERWEARADHMHAAGEWDKEKFARARARGCASPVRDRVDACGSKMFAVRCECGIQYSAERCGQRWLCSDCRKKQAHKFTERAIEALNHHVEQAPDDWFLRLVTPTVRHSGELELDRARIQAGLRAVWKYARRKINRMYGRAMWRFVQYVQTWECTPGAKSDGHVHAHVVVLLPPFIDYGKLREVYLRATDDQGVRFDIRHHPKGNKTSFYSPAAMVRYLAKYVSKGVQLGGFPPELAGFVTGAFYMQRLVNVKQKFWVSPWPRCRDCGDPFCKVLTDWRETAGDFELGSQLRELLYRDGPYVARPPPESERSADDASEARADRCEQEW